MTRRAISVCILLLTSASPALSAEQCFVVHGRLEQSNGVPGIRLWRVGTKRVLGVLDCKGKDESPFAIPPAIKKLAGEYVSVPVLGDYSVCPLTKQRPGRMQMVCIKSATHIALAK
jgi:hypothetical protein